MKRDIVWTTKFKKDYKLAIKRNRHLQPDWIFVYRIEDDVLVLILSRTGSHSDLLGK